MQKRIIIVCNNMHIGGVQKALVNLLWNIRKQYNVTLLLLFRGGDYLQELPPEINVITVHSAYCFLGMLRSDTHGIIEKIGYSFFAAISRILGRKYAIALMRIGQKKLGKYDVAISYLHNAGDKSFFGGCNDFLLNHVSAEKKIAFLHCDYSLCGANTSDNNRMYHQFDIIAACSQGCAETFLKVNPELADKVVVVPNCHRFDDIQDKAQSAAVALSDRKLNVVTIARLGKEKGVERALMAIANLGAKKDMLHYYVIGDGVQRKRIEQIIEEHGLAECVTLCGMLPNPYGYLKAADLLLIPSYSEAAPLVIGEAACLGTPILSTETSSAREMIEQPGYGWVCENSVEGMRDALHSLLCDDKTLHSVKIYLSERKIDNSTAISNFKQLLDRTQ